MELCVAEQKGWTLWQKPQNDHTQVLFLEIERKKKMINFEGPLQNWVREEISLFLVFNHHILYKEESRICKAWTSLVYLALFFFSFLPFCWVFILYNGNSQQALLLIFCFFIS